MPEDLRAARRRKLEAWRESGRAYPNHFKPDSVAKLVLEHDEKSREQLNNEKPRAKVAGRVMLRRDMGGASFATVQDDGWPLQVYFRKSGDGANAFNEAESWDLGDIVGIEGEMFKTRTGELTLRARKAILLVKSLIPPPEKFRGLRDPEERYRRRYMAMASNFEDREVIEKRSQIIRHIRDFFHKREYLEAETPILQHIPGGAAARPFVTKCNALGRDLYLRIAQEIYIKSMLAGGFNRVFEINKNFRNEGVSRRHNPEFTMLEFNAAYQTCEDFMLLTEELLHGLATKFASETVLYQDQEISFARPFARLTAAEAVRRARPEFSEQDLADPAFLRARLAEIKDDPEAKQAADSMGVGELQMALFEEVAESSLIAPTFLYDIPAAVSPLARRSPDNPDVAERFELFVAGFELVNGFSEQNDPREQDRVFRAQAKQRAAGDNEAMYYDADYIQALEYGLPPNAGGGIGIDRLVMLLTDSPAIRDVLPFPQLRASSGVIE